MFFHSFRPNCFFFLVVNKQHTCTLTLVCTCPGNTYLSLPHVVDKSLTGCCVGLLLNSHGWLCWIESLNFSLCNVVAIFRLLLFELAKMLTCLWDRETPLTTKVAFKMHIASGIAL